MSAFLFYNRFTGAGAVGKVNKDDFRTTSTIADGGFAAGWAILESVGAGVYFYNASTGEAASGHEERGSFKTDGTEPPGFLAKSWTHIQGGMDSNLLFYRAPTGEGAIVRGRTTTKSYPEGSFARSWSHVVNDGGHSTLFYNAATGAGAIAEWYDSTPTPNEFSGTDDIRTVKSYKAGSFAPGWSRIEPMADRKILFYNRQTGAGAVGELSGSGFTTLHSYAAGSFTTGWTHIASDGEALVFYNSGNGAGAVGFSPIRAALGLDPERKAYPPGSFKTGWTHLVGMKGFGVPPVLR